MWGSVLCVQGPEHCPPGRGCVWVGVGRGSVCCRALGRARGGAGCRMGPTGRESAGPPIRLLSRPFHTVPLQASCLEPLHLLVPVRSAAAAQVGG